MTIYADQMFVENFIMNFIILYITAKLCSIEWKWYKLSIGAVIGAMYVIFSYMFGFYAKSMIMEKILLSMVIVFSSFMSLKLKVFLKELLYFYFVSFFIGGISFGLAYFFNVVTVKEGGILYVEEFPVIMVALGTAITFTLGKYAVIFLRNSIKELIYTVRIKILDKVLETVIFYDSGHSVYEPFTNYPVVILEKNIFKDIIPVEVLMKIEKQDFNFDEKWKKKFRIIPVSTINSEKEMLCGFKTDEFILFNKDGKKYISNVIIVFCEKRLSKDDSYFGLMGKIL